MEKKIAFSDVTFDELNTVVSIIQEFDEQKFDDWFNFAYELSAEEERELSALLDKNKRYVSFYSEEELKAMFIIPILNKVDFFQHGFRNWYERTIHTKINGNYLSGKVDYMVAKGIRTPQTPYFFIQEFKPEITTTRPDDQLLAELIVAIDVNKNNTAKGAVVIGQLWRFAILEKDNEGQYHYYISNAFDSFKLEDLIGIYKNLQAIKHSLPKD